MEGLARRNLAAPSDTAREGRDGEPVCVQVPALKSGLLYGVTALVSVARPVPAREPRRHDERRSRISPRRPSRAQRERGPTALGSSQAAVRLAREERQAASASDGKEAGSGVPGSDHEDVRGRHGFGEGFSKAPKALGSSASSTLKRRRRVVRRDVNGRSWRLRIAPPTLPLPDHANGRGRVKAPSTDATMA